MFLSFRSSAGSRIRKNLTRKKQRTGKFPQRATSNYWWSSSRNRGRMNKYQSSRLWDFESQIGVG